MCGDGRCMRSRGIGIRIRIVVIAALGLALALYLVAYVGLRAVFSAAAALGWSGFAVLCLYGLTLFPLLGLAGFVVLPSNTAVRWRVFVWTRMVRDAATDVLPFSQLGGIVLSTRAAILAGRLHHRSPSARSSSM